MRQGQAISITSRNRGSLRVLLLILTAFSPLLAATGRAQAESKQASSKLSFRAPEFEVTPEIQNRIEFWKLVFTRYGKDQLVFHHRAHPHIIYSVLDLSEFVQKYSGKELARYANQAEAEEIRRIQDSLRRLSDEGAPKSPAERRLYQLFKSLPGRVTRNLEDAAEVELIRSQRGIKELFREGIIRSGRYLHAMEQVFAKEGLPVEITRLPLVESSFNYNAYSSVGAAGIWQFMRATGKRYLRIDASIDERRDPLMATRAAARYLRDAYNRLGSWPLAITSYNHGVTGVLRGVNAAGSKDLATIIRRYDGDSFGFASKNFYAEFMAALEVEQHAERYFPGIQRESTWHFDEIRIGRPISFRELVSYSGSSDEEIERFNTALMKPVTTGRVKIPSGFIVRVPQGRGKTLLANVGRGEVIRKDEVDGVIRAQITRGGKGEPPVLAGSSDHGGGDRSAIVGSSYTVKSGDTISTIAKKFSITQDELRRANSFGTRSALRAGSKILVPSGRSARAPAERSTPSEAERTATKREERSDPPAGVTSYQVTAGDTVGSIAARFGVSTASLLKANPGLKPKSLRVGRSVKVPAGRPGTTAAVTGEAKGRMYSVQSGDTLFKISRKLGVPVSQLQKLNPGVEKGIKPGQELLTGIQ